MINLFINYYKDDNLERQKEIDFCLNKNLTNPLLNLVVLNNQNRLTYDNFFFVVNKYTGVEDINIIANSDIYFDESIERTSVLTQKQCFALARWNINHDGTSTHFNRSDSQDCWIFRGKITDVAGDFFLGYRGCDNRIAYEIQKSGWNISNPSLTIKSYHLHLSNVRNYSVTDNKFLVPGPYLPLYPSFCEANEKNCVL